MNTTNEKRDYLSITLLDMIQCAPIGENVRTLNKLHESLFYQAPEILDNYWTKIFMECKDEFNDEEVQWHGKIRDIYDKRMREYFKLN